MNWQHLKTFFWLRWRLAVNQWRRAGTLNLVLMMIFAVSVAVMAVPLFIGSVFVGIYAFDRAEPVHLMYVWDGLVIAFVFFWMIGVLTELQRSEPLSLSKFLHLPVSVNGAFLINYVSSLLRLSLILFGPVLFGLSIGLVVSKGPMLILVLPAVAAFLLMISAITYQFQGWLASLMSNPRRRRTVVVATTIGFILIVQAPNLLNLSGIWRRPRLSDREIKFFHEQTKLDQTWLKGEISAEEHARRRRELTQQNPGLDRFARFDEEYAELDRALLAHEISPVEHDRLRGEVNQKFRQALAESDHVPAAQIAESVRLINLVVPLGWLPVGVKGAAVGNPLPALLGILGMALIGSTSLWRAYRTTVRLYQGGFTTRKPRSPRAAARPAKEGRPRVLLVERRLIGCSEPVSAIALAGLRSLLRSPEAKMMLLGLVIMSGFFVFLVSRASRDLAELLRPLIGTGGLFVVLLGLIQLMSNQFGFDRDGFRVFVLCAASRRDILLGKNLTFALVAAFAAAINLAVVGVMLPMRPDHLLALLPQAVSMYLMFCLVVNVLSIYVPMHIAPGALKPANPKVLPILLQMLVTASVFPMTQLPLLVPLGIEALLESQHWTGGFPVYLPLSVVCCALVVVIYKWLIQWEGRLLQAREQKILESVTKM